MDSDDRTHGTQSNCERGNYGAKKKQTFSWEAAGHYSFCLDQKKLSSFLLATTIFIGSRVNDKHPCPSISMDPDRVTNNSCRWATATQMRISMTTIKGQNQ